MEKKVKIKNFIGIYDNYIPKVECDKAIKLFEDQNRFNNTLNRVQFENASPVFKKDTQLFLQSNNIDLWYNDLKNIMVNFDLALKNYEKQTSIKEYFGLDNHHYGSIKIQKTLPTEGYHVWHVEHGVGYDNEKRSLAYTIYLNDVAKGGETEFLHQSVRVKPKTGRIVIWPAGFPYAHRGNPPLSGKKYLITSWMMLRP